MAYSNFTLGTARKAFQLEKVDAAGIFADIEPVPPSELLTRTLERNVPLASTIGTEKAKSEMIIVNVLIELREQLAHRVSLFSGIDFNVDADADLTGVCDFVVSLSPDQFDLEAPVIILVEAGFNSKFQLAGCAERGDLRVGLGQCVAEMVAAQRFNTQAGNDIPRIYGATTTGVLWRFLKLEGQKLHIDMSVYQIERCDKVLGILASMVKQKV